MAALTRIKLSGYKSIRQMSLDLRPLNVFIGPNGAGKSNLVSFFRLLNAIVAEREGQLQKHVGTSGGANALLFYGPKRTPRLEATLEFEEEAEYHIGLEYAEPDTLVFAPERFWSRRVQTADGRGVLTVGAGHRETLLIAPREEGKPTAEFLRALLRGLCVFHFHDTSRTSHMRQAGYINDNRFLRYDAGNLAAILYKLQQTQSTAYQRIVQTIRQIAPWFGDFVLGPSELNEKNILLNWQERGSDFEFGPHLISDGTLRAMALVTLLLQPTEDLPSVVVIDEPELGLHPSAIAILAALMKQAACHCQIIAATQSTALLDQFEPEDVIVVDRDDRASVFRRVPDQMSEKDLHEWLAEYSLSELWEKNVLGGGPA